MKLKSNTKKFFKSILLWIKGKNKNNYHSCNICGWNGEKFGSNKWHKHSKCPNCGSDVRQRLLIACIEYSNELDINLTFKEKKILHFAPEESIKKIIKLLTPYYKTADFLRSDCDYSIDLCDMNEISSSSFDILIAFDVLEHVPNFQKALIEIYRILKNNEGIAILSVPQRDNLLKTYEDKTIKDPIAREKAYGQKDHLRIFGDSFPNEVSKKGFKVKEISWKSFNDIVSTRYMLRHPIPSPDINATNNRRLYICKKIDTTK